MNREFHELEHELDRDLARLRPRLDVAGPSIEVVSRITDTVQREAARIRGGRRKSGIRAFGMSAAAALLLAGSFGWFERMTASPVATDAFAVADAELWVDDWVSAAAGSEDRLSMVVQRSWTSEDSISDGSDEDAIDSFLESFDRIEKLTGAS